MDVVMELIMNEGNLVRPDPAEVALRRDGPSLLILLSVFVFFAALVLSFVFDSPYPFAAPAVMFALALGRVMRRVFENVGTMYVPIAAREKVLSAARKHFDAQTTEFLQPYRTRSLETSEMVKPPSVTERTTRHLDIDP